MLPDVDIAIIGAGPHGLSAAAHLRRAGVNAQVFGEPMSFWRGMPNGMMLRSNLSATNMVEPTGPLSLSAYSADTGYEIRRPVPLERFVDYGLWVQQNAVPDVDTRTVLGLRRHSGGFVLDLADGQRVFARRVAIACGIAPFADIPPKFSHLPSALASHTGSHADLAAFAGRRVAVIGRGQSAFECAALMQEHGADVEVLARAPEVVWLRGRTPISYMGRFGPIVYAPTDVGPLWYSRLVAVPGLFRRLPRRTQTRIAARSIRPACSNFVRVRLEDVRLTADVEVASARADGNTLRLGLSDGTKRHVDHLMFGTGYKVDVAEYQFLNPKILAELRRVDGYPVLRRGLESSVEGLHFLGAPAAWSFGPILRFVSGSWYAGRALAHTVKRSPVRSPRASNIAEGELEPVVTR